MMTIMFLALIVAAASLAFLLPYLSTLYVRHLPDAPLCPGCRSLTRGEDAGLIAAVLPALTMTVVRECARCGWRGRMRLRLAEHGAPRA